MNARLFRYASVGAMLALSLGSALPTQAAPPRPNETTKAPSQTASPAAPMVGSDVIYDSLLRFDRTLSPMPYLTACGRKARMTRLMNERRVD